MRILVVDDNEEFLSYLRVSLEAAGHEVVSAGSLKAAWFLLRVSRLPDLVILDWCLPDGDGIAFCKELKGESSTMHLPVIMLTGNGGNAFRVEAQNGGAALFLDKPISPDLLDRSIKNVVSQARERGELHKDGLFIDRANRAASFRGKALSPLSPRLFDLLVLLAARAPESVSRPLIADQLIPGARDREVDVLVSRLRLMIRRRCGLALVETVPGVGYRLALATKSA